MAMDRASNADSLPLAFTNYQALTPEILLAVASASLQGVDTNKALPASSSLIFEVWEDLTVHGYLNDQEYTPAGCSAAAPCTAEAFKGAI